MITLIGILAVAVLSALNPIEQVNKAKDASKSADSSQMVNALDRYFASNLVWPWTRYTTNQLNNDSGFGAPVYYQGVGVCAAELDPDGNPDLATHEAAYPANGTSGCAQNGLLISSEELKDQFAKRSYFKSGTGNDELLYVQKLVNNNSVSVCYKPASKATRDLYSANPSRLKKLTLALDANGVYVPGTTAADKEECTSGPGGTQPNLDWASLDPNKWCFICIPDQ